MRREKGSMVVEASLVFPLVVLVMLAFIILVRYFVVYEIFQHGLYETTREVSSYYYLYSAIGLEQAQNEIQNEGKKAQENLDELIKPFNTTINTMTNIAGAFSNAESAVGKLVANPQDALINGNLESIAEPVDKIVKNAADLPDNFADIGAALELVAENPLETLTYVLKSAGASGVDAAFNLGMNLVTGGLMSKHVPGGVQQFARVMGVDGLKIRTLWNSGGSQGEIQMIFTYEFTIRLFNGFKFQVIQKSVTRGWGIGV